MSWKWFVGCPFSFVAKRNRLGVGWSLKFGRRLPPGVVNRAAVEESMEVMIVGKSKGSFLISLIWWCQLLKTCELPPTLSLAHLGGIGNSPCYLLLFFFSLKFRIVYECRERDGRKEEKEREERE